MSDDNTQKYVFEAGFATEKERLESMTEFFEPGTHRLIIALGIAPGWRVLEVGGGSGNTASWLCRAVGAQGKVVATDLDPRFLEQLEHSNLEVRTHDITKDPLEESVYDLAHCRLLLEWLPARVHALRNMVAAVKSGSWVLCEDYDFVTWGSWSPDFPLGLKVKEAVITLFGQAAGFDPQCGLKLPGMLADAGLVEVAAEGRCNHTSGGSRNLNSLVLLLQQLRPTLLGAGLLSVAEIDEMIRECRTPTNRWGYSPQMVAAWGRKC
jgi:SAM-dependent methyltransferase